ncbi:MAG: Trm112 family protein [Actinomycetota bacterium]|nr:Trm112 family protein [Ilumatobacteraceae bacterium]MDA2959903.1 Trm112 family protein [Actinomycetota bacterium]MDA3007769.1 Trm112 family protein [Actinomycetota bacterium]MDA3035196.1 Trm112 family protein [Actinomycetota bacterium]NBU95585.1 Trm112 family protein [Actinomycetota bacterium]
MAIPEQLLEILVCPEDKGPLSYIESEQLLFNPRLRRTYPVVDDIPVLLVEESSTVDDAEAARLSGIGAD